LLPEVTNRFERVLRDAKEYDFDHSMRLDITERVRSHPWFEKWYKPFLVMLGFSIVVYNENATYMPKRDIIMALANESINEALRIERMRNDEVKVIGFDPDNQNVYVELLPKLAALILRIADPFSVPKDAFFDPARGYGEIKGTLAAEYMSLGHKKFIAQEMMRSAA
jgi:hypothetical protein